MKNLEETTIGCPPACRALCCKYIVNGISAPRTKSDFDEIYWFLCHERVAVYIDGRKWHLLVDNPCMYLDDQHRCQIYSRRPNVCRIHPEENCEYTGDLDFEEFMQKPEDLRSHMERRGLRYRMPWNGNKAKSGGGAKGDGK